MKKILFLSALFVSSLGFAQSRQTIADYVLAMPNDLRLVDHPQLKTWLGNTKTSENVQRGCAKVEKDLTNDYLSLTFGGCEAGSGDLNIFAFAAWRSSGSAAVTVGAQTVYDTTMFGALPKFSRTTDGKKFTDVTDKTLPLTALKAAFAKCKVDFEDASFQIPKRGTSIAVKAQNNATLGYGLDWNNKSNLFVLGKGKC
jgi:hypothetical protein